jgi:tetratricopeptide (TPR) repeat protein
VLSVLHLLAGGPSPSGPLSAQDYLQRADTHWHSGDYDAAERDDTRAIELRPDSPAGYNLRALVRASAGRPQEALVDADQAVGLCQAQDCAGLPSLLDTRGYVFLKLARYESAVNDYQRAMDDGFPYPTAVLGRGVAYAALGRSAQALDDLQALGQPAQVRVVSDPELEDLVLLARQTRARLQRGG